MRVHYLQHVSFEGLGSIAAWCSRSSYSVSQTKLYNAETLPQADEVDLLIILGGPMSVNDERLFPWLVEEKRFIARVIELGKPVLGICLGAQLIACALGARVYRNAAKEIGWFPVRAVTGLEDSLFAFPNEIEVFHWHGETFDLPNGARLLASSEGCRNQAFQYGHKIVGLQFHLETTPDLLKSLVNNCGDELVDAPFIQSEDALLSTPMDRFRRVNEIMEELLAFLVR